MGVRLYRNEDEDAVVALYQAAKPGIDAEYGCDLRYTRALLRQIAEDPGHRLIVYEDASGKLRGAAHAQKVYRDLWEYVVGIFDPALSNLAFLRGYREAVHDIALRLPPGITLVGSVKDADGQSGLDKWYAARIGDFREVRDGLAWYAVPVAVLVERLA